MKNKRSIKIIQSGLKSNYIHDLYHRTIKTSWINFFLISALFYVLMNFIFGLIYFYSPAEILNAKPGSLWDAFVFSFQTSSTLGYGHLLPNTEITHLLVMLDTMMGIFYVAIVTGLAFAKFARPSAKVLFSDRAIITDFDGIPTLMFRLGNGRSTHIIDASLNVAVLIPYKSKEGHELKRFYTLKLLSNNNPTFSLSWTAMHQMDKSSPLFEMSLEEMREQKILLFVSFTGIDSILSQTVHSNYRYTDQDIIRAKKFKDILSNGKDPNTFHIDFEHFHKIDL